MTTSMLKCRAEVRPIPLPFSERLFLKCGCCACSFLPSPGRSYFGPHDAVAQQPESEPPREMPAGDAVVRAPFGPSEIVITTTTRLAGAIHSLTWNGREFIDSADHGRQLQSASSFDNAPAAGPETFNPTEAGRRLDGSGPRSTSRLLELSTVDNVLRTRTQMAFWLAPGERSSGQLARNTAPLSGHVLHKEVRIGALGLPKSTSSRLRRHIRSASRRAAHHRSIPKP